jgi:two-component system phosphate regulon response regulator PhoB
MPATVLIVEDEPAILELIAVNLEHAGFETLRAKSAEEAGRLLADILPDLVLLDWMLPGQSGLALARRLRGDARTRDMPLIFLTARADEPDKIAGLEAGADDYITKPFAVRELLARIKAALRRTGVGKGLSRVMHIGDATIDLVKGKVERGATVHSLGHFELEILKILVEHAEQPVDRNKLLDVIWGLEGFPITRTVDNHIVSLRRKIEPDPKRPRHIVTVHSIGYKFVP